MNMKKDLEDEIGEFLANGGQLIPADELGFDKSDFVVSSSEINRLNDGFYEDYVKDCHRPADFWESNSMPMDVRNQKSVINDAIDTFSLSGMCDGFRWWSLTAYYPENAHKMTEEKKKQNDKHHYYCELLGVFMGMSLGEAIDSQKDLINYLRRPCVVNTAWLAPPIFRKHNYYLSNYFMKMFDQEQSAVTLNGSQVGFNVAMLRGKDLIFPYHMGDESTIHTFAKTARDIVIGTGANSAVGIFASMVMTPLDGKRVGISKKDVLPIANGFFGTDDDLPDIE